MKKPGILTALVVATALAVVAAAPAETPYLVETPTEEQRAVDAVREHVMTPVAEFACTNDCTDCAFGTATKSYSLPIGWEGDYQDESYSCAAVPCPHPCFNEEEEQLADADLEALWAMSSDAGSIDELRKFVAAHDQIVLNEERGAIQVAGCQSLIIAHIPLTAIQLDQLTD